MSDPILNAIQIRIQRFFLFIIWSFLFSVILWIWVLLGWFDVGLDSVWRLSKTAYLASEEDKTIVLVFRGCGLVSVLTTSVTFLVAALWWSKSGDVHRRGTQFIDARDGRS